tara:strand:+ start:632 stop:994 length:363 start_codon:yes stop_codon:yes gene_type:complete
VKLPSHVVQALRELVLPPSGDTTRDARLRKWFVQTWLAAKVTAEPAESTLGERDHFGVCPICGGCDGGFNVQRSNWFACDTHKLIWCVGENLLSTWRHETEDDWEQNMRDYGYYAEVEAW